MLNVYEKLEDGAILERFAMPRRDRLRRNTLSMSGRLRQCLRVADCKKDMVTDYR